MGCKCPVQLDLVWHEDADRLLFSYITRELTRAQCILGSNFSADYSAMVP